jgi:hypothetical protein
MLKILAESVSGAKNTKLVTHDGYLVRELKVDLSTFPDGADRQDALKCGWLEISPYWRENYELVYGPDGILRYQSR